MPGPYGSLANPVELDPFQQIVNVHWGSPYIAANIAISVATIFDVEIGPGGGPAYIAPFSFYSTTLATYSYPTDGGLGEFLRFSGGSWHEISGEVAVSGEPALPGPYGFSRWQWQGIDGAGLKAPFFSFAPGEEGEALVPTVPGHSGEHFTDGLAGNVVLKAQGFVPGGPFSSPGGETTIEMWETGQSSGPGFGIPTIQSAETASLSVAGMTVEIAGKTYAAIGTKIIVEEGLYPEGQFWVLFKRQDVAP
ncbi:hypothetical protein NKI61_20080 [Mesorhizobium sp. M0514]|uniref:hypothetical protein n=1 Tax=Mesorhizobium sp. M0514 TaxID=2956955 RepID=UPI003335254A